METILGYGDFRYAMDSEWGTLPEGMSYREVPDVVTGPDGHVYAFSRGDQKMIVLDSEGHYITSWGQDLFARPHGVSLSHDGTLWCVDDGDHTVRRCTTDGHVLLTIGTPGKPAPAGSGHPFNRPTKVAEAPVTHNLYISDGYGNARVHKYTPEGELLFSWGAYGTGPGEFNLVHLVSTDAQGYVYIADRENHRIQVFDPDGNYVREWRNHLHRPCGLYIGADQLVYVGQLAPGLPVNRAYPNLGARVSIHDLNGELIAWLGADRPGLEPGQFLAPHGLAVDSHGDIYVGEVSWTEFGSKQDPPPEVRSLRKLVRL
jgi:DNA-binding beta-propeller fold protein YncE